MHLLKDNVDTLAGIQRIAGSLQSRALRGMKPDSASYLSCVIGFCTGLGIGSSVKGHTFLLKRRNISCIFYHCRKGKDRFAPPGHRL